MTKAMTGLVIADAVRRGEVRMDAPVATYLPQLEGSPAGTATLQELVTHTAGYAEFGAATVRRAAWMAPLGKNFFTADSAQMTEETRNQTLQGRGRYAYSTLGSAIAGQAVAAAAHLSYPDLMRTRLFEPLGMSDTAIQVGHALVAGGRSESGLPVQPWVMDAYAPGGAAVSTTRDLAKLATALLDGTAPGMAALEPTTATDQSNTPHRQLLADLHLGDRSNHHPSRRADQRLRLLPRPRPPPTQGRHRLVRHRQRRQRPRRPAPRRPQVDLQHHRRRIGATRPHQKDDMTSTATPPAPDSPSSLPRMTQEFGTAPADYGHPWSRAEGTHRLDRGRLVGHRNPRCCPPGRCPVHSGGRERPHRRGPVRIRAGLGDAGGALGAVHRSATTMGRCAGRFHGSDWVWLHSAGRRPCMRRSAGCGRRPSWASSCGCSCE